MDTLTHALSGALIARASAPRKNDAHTLPLGPRIAVGFFAAAFPDADVVASFVSPLGYLYNHRGVTHSLVMLPLWATLIGSLAWALWRGKARTTAYIGVAALGIATHIAGDVITNYGTMIFAPLSNARYALSTTFIIDLWFTGIIAAGLTTASIWRRSRVPSAIAVAVLVGYVASQWMLQQRAVQFGETYARAQNLERVTVTAMPRPVSPFNWTVFVADDARYRYAHVNLVRKEARPEASGFFARLDAPYRPLDDARWVVEARYGASASDAAIAREAFESPAFAFYRWFAMYPAVLRVEHGNPHRCAWFHDLRFVTPGRDGTPFEYGACRESEGPWRAFRFAGGRAVPLE